uniref:Uncharacterized protein n=1 Tax=Photinus pyralis TaxID=7054 RepID=A0A1Y1MQH2_PHOPY
MTSSTYRWLLAYHSHSTRRLASILCPRTNSTSAQTHMTALKRHESQHGQTASSEKALISAKPRTIPHRSDSQTTARYMLRLNAESTLLTRENANISAASCTSAAKQM